MRKAAVPNEHTWSSMLKAGDEVRLHGSGTSYAWVSIATVGGIGFLYLAIEAFQSLVARTAPAHAPPETPPWLVLAFVPVWVFALAYLWGLMLRSRIQFCPSHFDYWDWRGKRHRFEYANVIALRWGTLSRDRPPGRIAFCSILGSQEHPHWTGILVDRHLGGLTRAIRDEIVARCGLTESDRPGDREAAVLFWRPGARDRIRPFPREDFRGHAT